MAAMDIWFSSAGNRGFAGLRAGWRLLVFVLLLVFLFPALDLALLALMRRIGPPATVFTPLVVGASEALPLALLVLVSWLMSRFERKPLGSYGLPPRAAFGRLFWQGAGCGAASLSLLVLLIFVSGGVSFGHVLLQGPALARYATTWAVAFLLVGFFEEFAFRGYALTTLTGGIGFWPAAILLSLAFGSVHLGNSGEDLLGALSAGLIGLFFCFTWRRTGSLWFAVGLHAAWDYCESFVYGVPDSGTISAGRLFAPTFHGSHWITGGTVGPEGSVWVFAIVALLFAAFAALYPAALPPAATPSPSSTASSEA
jgi:membrane protease YdiL (CAAX protease family)